MSDAQMEAIAPRWGEIKEEGEAWTWGRVVREANAVGNDWRNALTADQVRVLGNDIKLLMKRMRDDHVRRINALEKELIGAKKLHPVVQRRAGLCAILQRAIESISEEWSCATWHMGIEYHLWRIITQGGGGLSETEAAGLRAMSHLIGGWLWWPEAAAAPQFIALDDWQREYERFSKPTPTEKESDQ